MGLKFIDNYLKLLNKNEPGLSLKESFLSFNRIFILIMFLATVIPLTITTSLSYYKYRALIKQETIENAQWNAEITRQGIEAFIDKLRATIQVVSEAYTYKELSKQENLEKVFERLKAKNKGLVDLSVIGPDGVQQAYAGPFNLLGKDYGDRVWYQRALARKTYVSEVFMGYRNTPHFVIAISKKITGIDGYWVLRASLDTDTLDQFLANVRTENLIDVFLINNKGVLQSSSRSYGNVFARPPVEIEGLPRSNRIVTEEKNLPDTTIISVTCPISETPWFLVLEQQGYSDKKTWITFRQELQIIYVISVLIVLGLIFPIAAFLIAAIRRTEETREAVLAECEHANKLTSIGRLAAGIAHEINNPLAIINEKAGLMKDLLQTSDDFKYKDKFFTNIESVENAVKRSKTITHRLLGFARRMDVTLEPVQVNTVIAEVIDFLSKEAADNEIRIEQSLQADLPKILSDHGQMQQIFLNIVNNAIDALDKGGLIRITSKQAPDKTVQVDIQDNGPGIPPEILDKVFEPFFTTKKSPDKQGTGLGLSITYGLVKKLEGKISVSSEVGTGTTFTIIFPEKLALKETETNA